MRLRPSLLLLPFVGALCSAQTFQPKTITFTGAPALSQAEQLTASGLIPGKVISPADIQAATQRLADTGAYAEVRFAYNAQSITFTVKPAEAMLPVRYVNFPWWSDDALNTQVAERVPLFHGKVPLSGAMEGSVAHALEQLLEARHVTAAIEANPESDPKNGEIAAIAYQVTEPRIAIGALTFTGDTSGWLPALNEVAKVQAGKDYTEGDSANTLQQSVVRVYRNKGFAQATVAATTPGAPVEQAGTIAVPYTIAITAGEQYRLGHFSLTGSTLIDAAAFLKAAPLKPGDLDEEDKLRQSLYLVAGPYAAQGYIDAQVQATPEFHPEQRLVDYSITVVPGEPYRMGQLSIHDLDDARLAEVLKVWRLNPGDPFNTTYAPTFLKSNAARLRMLDGYSAKYRQIKHLDTHVVDLDVTFRKDKTLGAE